MALTLDMLMMAPPPPCFTICRAAAWPARKMPFRFTASTRSKSASSRSRNSAACTMPALPTRMSRRPNSFTAAATAASTSALRETSHAAKLTGYPSERSRRTSRWPARSFTSESSTWAPSRAKACAQASPMPCAAPVTRATLSASLTLSLRLRRVHHGGELGAERLLPLGAALRAARIDRGAIVLRSGTLEGLVNELLELRVLLHRGAERPDVLPLDDEAQERVGVEIGDFARVAVREIEIGLLHLRPVDDIVDALFGLGLVRRGARLVRRVRRSDRGQERKR